MARRGFAQDWYSVDRRARSTPEGAAGGAGGLASLLLVPFIGLARLVMDLIRGRRRRPETPTD